MTRSALLIATILAITFLLPRTGSGQEPGREIAPPRKLKAFKLKYVSANAIADKLTARFGADARITPDVAINTVFIQADAETIRLAESVVDRLEDQCRRNRNEGMAVAYLKHADVTQTANALSAIIAAFSMLDDEWEWCHIRAIPRANAIVISANAEKAQWLLAILRELDAKAKVGNSR